MKKKWIETWKGIRAMGKWRFVFCFCCAFYCPVSIVTTLRHLWPDGEFLHFGSFIYKTIIFLAAGFLIALFIWNTNENELRKVLKGETKTV